jgi:hypothetical protein
MRIEPAEDDEIMAELYRIRLAMLARFDNDLDAMMDHIQHAPRNSPNPRMTSIKEDRERIDRQQHETNDD